MCREKQREIPDVGEPEREEETACRPPAGHGTLPGGDSGLFLSLAGCSSTSHFFLRRGSAFF
jgi:hypothetical protein